MIELPTVSSAVDENADAPIPPKEQPKSVY